MRPVIRSRRGFTLFEVIIVIAVISILVAVLTPRVMVYLDDANVVRAHADANAIAAAINKMYEDTGRFPFYKDGDGDLLYEAGTDYALLTSNPACAGAVADVCDTTIPADAVAGTWDLDADLADSLQHHLIMNKPGNDDGAGEDPYQTTGRKAWEGPYLHRIPDVDPWGRSYLVNVANANPNDMTPSWVVVISAGPDGVLDSDCDALMSTAPEPADDDIVAYVK